MTVKHTLVSSDMRVFALCSQMELHRSLSHRRRSLSRFIGRWSWDRELPARKRWEPLAHPICIRFFKALALYREGKNPREIQRIVEKVLEKRKKIESLLKFHKSKTFLKLHGHFIWVDV